MLDWLKEIKNKINNWLTKETKFERVSFIKEDGLWYFDYPNYPLAKHNLLMVNGSDKLLDSLSQGCNKISMDVYFTESLSGDYKRIDTILLERTHGHNLSGYYYNVYSTIPMMNEAYFCPVMYFKYGYYPKYIIIDETSIINKN